VKPAKLLAAAASSGDLAAMRALLAATPQLARDWQPLMDACFAGQVEAVRLLLDAGADPNVISRSAFRYRPLHRTIERKITLPRNETHVAVVRLLLARGADPLARATPRQITAVAMAAIAGDRRFLPLLLEGLPPHDVFTAAVLGDEERARALVEQGRSLAAAADENGWTALRYCSESGLGAGDRATADRLTATARLLIDAGADPDGCLDPVVYRNNAALTQLFLERGASLHDGDTLNHAACDGAHEALEVLVRHGVDLNLTRGTEHHGGYTPFGCALSLRSLAGARWFLDHGVDPNFVGGPAGESSLHVAVRSGAAPPLLQLLIDRGADPGARDASGATPLDCARARANPGAITVLGRSGAGR